MNAHSKQVGLQLEREDHAEHGPPRVLRSFQRPRDSRNVVTQEQQSHGSENKLDLQDMLPVDCVGAFF